MAKFTTIKREPNGSYTIIAKLELDGWSSPEFWPEDFSIPTGYGWPMSAIDALLNLFTGNSSMTSDHEGIEILDCLAWHIATLIDDWRDHLWSIDASPYDDVQGDRNAVGDTFMAELPEHIPSGQARLVADKNQASLEIERTKFLVSHTRKWYGQGLILYQVWRGNPTHG